MKEGLNQEKVFIIIVSRGYNDLIRKKGGRILYFTSQCQSCKALQQQQTTEQQQQNKQYHSYLISFLITIAFKTLNVINYIFQKQKLLYGEKQQYGKSDLWTVREHRPFIEKLQGNVPLLTGQRVLDTLYPSVLCAKCCIPRAFGSGKNSISQALSKKAIFMQHVEKDEMKQNNDYMKGEEENVILKTCKRRIYIQGISSFAAYFRDMGYKIFIMETQQQIEKYILKAYLIQENNQKIVFFKLTHFNSFFHMKIPKVIIQMVYSQHIIIQSKIDRPQYQQIFIQIILIILCLILFLAQTIKYFKIHHHFCEKYLYPIIQ